MKHNPFSSSIKDLRDLDINPDAKELLLKPMLDDTIFSESDLCPVINALIKSKMISIEEAYAILGVLGLIDEECLKDEYICDDYLELIDDEDDELD